MLPSFAGGDAMDEAGLVDKEDLGSTHTSAREVRGEVLTGPERRRRWNLEQKLRILPQSVAPGSSASLVCRLLAPSNGKTRNGRLWTYVVDQRPWQGTWAPAAYYRFSPDRRGERPRDHLAGFRGVIQADAFSGYQALTRATSNPPAKGSIGRAPPLIHTACWAHARRKFYDVFESTESPIAEEALKRIGELCRIEAEITGQPAEARLAARQNRAVAILDAIRDWLSAQRRLSSKNMLAKAIQYALSRWDALTRYAGDGRLAIDNNVAERALRGIAITRKNFLFLGSETGGERAATLYTVLETAKLNCLDPQTWLTDVIDRMARGHPNNRLTELLPWSWQPQVAALAG